jgi:hypothetical protein
MHTASQHASGVEALPKWSVGHNMGWHAWQVYRALTVLGKLKWKINHEVLDVINVSRRTTPQAPCVQLRGVSEPCCVLQSTGGVGEGGGDWGPA